MIENKSTSVLSDKRTWSLRKIVLKALDIAQIGDRLSRPTNISVVSLTTFSVFVVVFLMLASCATLTEAEKYAREDRLVLATEKYQRNAAACAAVGGVMTFNYTGVKSMKGPTAADYKRARCVKW